MSREMGVAHWWAMRQGLLLSATIGAGASFFAAHYGAPVMLFALLLGMAFHFLMQESKVTQRGVEFVARDVLRLGVALLGFRIDLSDVAALGWRPFAATAGLVLLALTCGGLLARIFRRHWSFGLLTGGAVGICGASAALALSAVLPRRDDTPDNTLFTVVGVTALSTVAMVTYPVLFSLLGLDGTAQGFLIGATIHDVAQVVGAGYSISVQTGDLATLIKLERVALLPVVLLLVMWRVRSDSPSSARVGLPWFVLAFIAFMLLNSTRWVPSELSAALHWVSSTCLVVAISALGVKTSLGQLLKVGSGALWILVLETLVLLCAALLVVQLHLL